MLKSVTFRSALAAVACAISFSVFAMANGPTQVDIPAGNLVPALEALEKQAAIELVFQPEQLKSFHTKGLKGVYEPKEAIRLLLKGTPLELRTDPTGAMVIVPSHTAASPAQAQTADQAGKPDNSRSGPPLGAQADQGGASSAATGGKQSSDTNLQEVVITGRYEFLSADTSGTTNLPLPIEQVPQSISLVSNDFIKAADLKKLGEIAEYTPGAFNTGDASNESTTILLRGFVAGRSIDGINIITTNGVFEPDYSIYDRLEVVKGPSSVIYGVGSPGGLVNYVTKAATPQTPDYLYAEGGSWSSYRLEGQVAGALDTQGRVRGIVLAVWDQGDSFVHEVNHNRGSIYGGVNFSLDSSVTGFIHGGFERQDVVSFFGVPPEPDGSLAPVARSFFIGSRNYHPVTDIYFAVGDFTWHPSDLLDISLKSTYQYARITGNRALSFGLQPSGDLTIEAADSDVHNWNYGVGLSSIYRLDKLDLKNSFISLAALYQDYADTYDAQLNAGAANIFNGETAISQAFDSLVNGPLPISYRSGDRLSTFTLSGQSIVEVIERLNLLLGISYAKPKESSFANTPSKDFEYGGQTSYRAGATYELMPRTYTYFSYSQSFQPKPIPAVGGGVIPPETGDQYELGVKYRDPEGRLLLTAAAFQIKEKNVGQVAYVDPSGVAFYEATGQVTHKGLEIQSVGQISRQWQINAGYAYVDPKISKDQNAAIVGQTELFLPKQTFSLYTTYTVGEGLLRGLSFGGGTRYVSSQRTSYDDSTKEISGYALVDLNLGYTLRNWLVQLNGHNVFDKHYIINYPYQSLLFGGTVGDPANVSLSVRRQF